MKIAITLFALLIAQGLALSADEPKSDELKRLSRYVGEWKGTINDQPDLSSTSKMAWTVGGTVLRQEYTYGDGATGLILRGYDRETNQYFFTLMDSRGITLLLPTGSWNEATKTFKFEGYSGANVVTVQSRFPSDDVEEWTITFAGSGGNVTELRGKNIRQ